MLTGLLADRFVRDASGWRDLATGQPVDLLLRKPTPEWATDEARRAAALMKPGPQGRTLVDYGTLGHSQCFEGYAEWPGLPSVVDMTVVGLAVARVVTTARLAQSRTGPVLLRFGCTASDRDHLLVALARALRSVGYVLLRSSTAVEAGVADEIRHRHVAVVLCGEDSPREFAAWIDRLVRTSTRAHLFCQLATVALRPAVAGDRGAPWLAPVAVAGLTGWSVRGVSSSSTTPSVRGAVRQEAGRGRMRLLQIVPGLLQVVHDAEDETVALRAGCAWVRKHAGAAGVAVVAGPNLEVVAEQGWSGHAVAMRDLHEVCREVADAGPAGPGVDGPAHVSAPVRYGGAVIGHVIGRGDEPDMGAIREAVHALAALSGPALRARLDAGQPPEDTGAVMPELVGRSPVMATVRESIRQAARTSFPVLIEGESGTGKELAARALHRLSARRLRRFMAVNCAALTDELVEAELFGFARGAFTGAVAARPGLFEEAHGGSLLLDEVGELALRAQAKLLRALQEREVRRVGENASRAVDVRIIAATNRPLAQAVAAGAFREDLLFRLAVVRVALPPLRDRLEDLPALAATFWRQAMDDVGKRARLSREALSALCDHSWPGNVRELQNVMAGLSLRAPVRGVVGARHVRAQLSGVAPGARPAHSLDELRRQCERHAVACALARHGGRRAAAARELGLSRQGLSKAMRRLGLATSVGAAGVA